MMGGQRTHKGNHSELNRCARVELIRGTTKSGATVKPIPVLCFLSVGCLYRDRSGPPSLVMAHLRRRGGGSVASTRESDPTLEANVILPKVSRPPLPVATQ